MSQAAGSVTEPPVPAAKRHQPPVLAQGIALRALPLFVFIHIQKTAGTTARAVFGRMFGGHVQFLTGPELKDDTSWRTPGYYDRYLMTGGHVGFAHPYIQAVQSKRRRVFVALWREPVARVISHYDYIRRMPRHPLHAELRELSLAEAFARSPRFRRVSVEHQLTYTFGSTEPAAIEDALAANSFVLASVQHLDGFIDALSALSGLPRPATIPTLNSNATGELPPDQRLPSARTQADFALATEQIAEANAGEAAFIERHLAGGVLTRVSLAPVLPPRRVAQEPAED